MEFGYTLGWLPGASKGEGLGNQFLANIRETDAIAHVVRCFVDPNVIHVANQIDPLADIEAINTELALADLELGEATTTCCADSQEWRQSGCGNKIIIGRQVAST